MQAGFAKTDITPRIGVELCGFGPYLNRHSTEIRDRLWARAMAVSDGESTAVILSCDLIGIPLTVTHAVRDLVNQATRLPPEAVMVHCIHTHSGPATYQSIGWGDVDAPYMELLPHRLANACISAVERLRPAVFSHAEAPCEGIGYNRERDQRPSLEDALRPDWRPNHPEITDTTCHVLRVDNPESRKLMGFLSCFGCHPVVCCAETRAIHGDFVGVATNLLERELDGAVGLFLQGAQGDVNTCVVHQPAQESLLALDVIAARYANAVRRGLRNAATIQTTPLLCILREIKFSRQHWSTDDLRTFLSAKEAILHRADVTDADPEVRMATVYVHAIRRLISRMETGASVEPLSELQGIRIGDVLLLGAPFETFQQIKNDVLSRIRFPTTLVMGLTNDSLGYAPDAETCRKQGYAAKQVPFMLGELPFANISDELTRGLLAIATALQADTVPMQEESASG